jgi:hypothetical protein
MAGAAVVAAWLGVDAERKPLEAVAPPLSAVVEQSAQRAPRDVA